MNYPCILEHSSQIPAILITALLRVQNTPGLVSEDVKRANYLAARLISEFHPVKSETRREFAA